MCEPRGLHVLQVVLTFGNEGCVLQGAHTLPCGSKQQYSTVQELWTASHLNPSQGFMRAPRRPTNVPQSLRSEKTADHSGSSRTENTLPELRASWMRHTAGFRRSCCLWDWL
jgi:hypothetical protein